MKRLLIVISIFISTITAQAQEFHNGTQVISAGIGIGSNWGLHNGTQSPAISLAYEQGVWDIDGPGVISLGAFVGHKSFKYNYNSAFYWYNQKLSYTIIGVRSAYHFNMIDVEKLDLYAGAMLSFNMAKYKTESGYHHSDYAHFHDSNLDGNYRSTIGLSFYGGARYYFTDNLAVFGELGYGVAYLNLGIAFKL